MDFMFSTFFLPLLRFDKHSFHLCLTSARYDVSKQTNVFILECFVLLALSPLTQSGMTASRVETHHRSLMATKHNTIAEYLRQFAPHPPHPFNNNNNNNKEQQQKTNENCD